MMSKSSSKLGVWNVSLVIYVASGPHTSPITDDDRNGRPLEIAGLLNVAARPINLGLYPWEEIAQVFMVSGTFGVLKTESKFYVTECHNLQQYHPINISIYLSKPSEFTRAELSLVSIPSLQTNCSILYCTQKGINSPNLLLLKDGFECTHNGHTKTCSCVHCQDKK